MAEPRTRIPTQLYLISPLDVGGDFPQRLERALAAGPVVSVEDPAPVMVPEAAPGSSGGIVVVPLLTLLIVAAAVAK